MKKLFFIITIVCTCFLLFACNKKEEPKPVSVDNGSKVIEENTNEQTEEINDKEYKEADFTDVAGFKVEKSEELSDSSYDGIFLKDSSTAQLDLKFKDDKIGTLIVSKKEIVVYEEDVVSNSLNNIEVASYKAVDGLKHFVWTKDGFFYEFLTNDDFSNKEIEKIVKGYSAK